MPHQDRPNGYRPHGLRMGANRARPEHPIAKGAAALAFAFLTYGALTSTAIGPDYGPVAYLKATELPATLSYSGDEVIITGSVGHMFETAGTFTGPNRNEKQNRARSLPDALAIARSFAEVRTRLAALRAAPTDPTDLPQSRPGDAPVTQVAETPVAPTAPAPDEDSPRISVASINPDLVSSALSAIDDAAGADPSVPVPTELSKEIAYARDNAPETNFDLQLNGKKVSEKDLWCLATAIYFESRGENYRGQVAVGQVVMNRVKHRLYPATICGVVFQNQHKRNACQFSFACDGIPETVNDRKSWAQAEEIARGVIRGELYLTEVAQATHYHATYVYPKWAPRMKKVTKIGLHVFYRFKAGWQFG